MKNRKIGTGISAGFAAVIMVCAALGVFALFKPGGIDRRAAETTTENVRRSYFVGQIDKNVQATYALGLRCAESAEAREKARIGAQIQALRTENAAVVAEYEKLVHTEKGRDLNEAFRIARSGFRESMDEMLKTGEAGTAESARRAREMAPQAQQLQSAIAFFRVQEAQGPPATRPPVRQTHESAPVRRPAGFRRVPVRRGHAPDLASLDRAVNGGAARTDLSSGSGDADAGDRDFARWRY